MMLMFGLIYCINDQLLFQLLLTGTVLNSLANPITPQATRAPEFPVVLLSGAFPLPKSSY